MARTKKKTKHSKSDKRTEHQDDLVFKSLSNADRRRILDLLKTAPKTTGEICQQIPELDRCTVMLHLKTLEKSGLVFTRKVGRFRWNYLDVAPIQQIYQRWIKDYAQPAASLLTQLKQQLE